MNDTTFSIVFIVVAYLAALYVLLLANYAACSLTHDEEEDVVLPPRDGDRPTFVRIR
jgi:hypothetical protein